MRGVAWWFVLAIILALYPAGVDDREIYLYDTFDGMTKPGDLDVSDIYGSAVEFWQAAVNKGERVWSGWFDEEVQHRPRQGSGPGVGLPDRTTALRPGRR